MADRLVVSLDNTDLPGTRTVRGNMRPHNNNTYYQHDERNNRGGHGHFRGGYRGGRWKGGGGGWPRNNSGIRSRLKFDIDSDAPMRDNDSRPAPRFTPYHRGGPKPGPSRIGHNQGHSFNQKRFSDRLSKSWRKIVIPQGRKLDRSLVIKSLQAATSRPFTYYQYQTDRSGDSMFFVEDVSLADEIARVAPSVQLPTGFKLTVKVVPCPTSFIPVSKNVQNSIKEVMSRRYNTATHALDLQEFARDPHFSQEEMYVPLTRQNVFLCVTELIIENIPQVTGINLSNNSLVRLEPLSQLVDQTPNLRVLLLSQNKIQKMSELDFLKKLPLDELALDGNPIYQEFRNRNTDYVSLVRKRWPKLKKLDGVELPPPIGFDVETTVSFPPSQGSFFVNEAAQSVAIRFVEQYIGLYDSADRSGLIDAYHDTAMFSITAYRNSKTYGFDYSNDSRNLLNVTNDDGRHRLLKCGREQIVAFLRSLPRTQHDPASFSIDLSFAGPTLINFCVHGVFKEVDFKSPSNMPAIIHSFSRVFILVPQGPGYCIVNEMLLIKNATVDQTKVAFRTPAPTPSSSPVPHIPASLVSPPVAVSPSIILPSPDAAANPHIQMVHSFSQQSGMNTDWSMKCLQENNWDFQKAAHVFTQLHSQHKIPDEAFIKTPVLM